MIKSACFEGSAFTPPDLIQPWAAVFWTDGGDDRLLFSFWPLYTLENRSHFDFHFDIPAAGSWSPHICINKQNQAGFDHPVDLVLASIISASINQFF